MKPHRVTSILSLLMAALGLSTAVRGACDTQRAEFRRTQELSVEASGARFLRISTRNGALELRGTGTNRVRGRVEKQVRARSRTDARRFIDQVQVQTRRDGDTLVVEAVWPERLPSEIGSARVSFDLEVPRGMAVTARSSNGRIEVADVARAALSTNNGPVVARRIADELDVSTANGSVVAEEVGGSTSLHTNNGAIRAVRIDGPLRADTSNGPIEAELIRSAPPSVELRTNNGPIRLRIPASLSARLTAETGRGRFPP
jgi:hypothetical protein